LGWWGWREGSDEIQLRLHAQSQMTSAGPPRMWPNNNTAEATPTTRTTWSTRSNGKDACREWRDVARPPLPRGTPTLKREPHTFTVGDRKNSHVTSPSPRTAPLPSTSRQGAGMGRARRRRTVARRTRSVIVGGHYEDRAIGRGRAFDPRHAQSVRGGVRCGPQPTALRARALVLFSPDMLIITILRSNEAGIRRLKLGKKASNH